MVNFLPFESQMIYFSYFIFQDKSLGLDDAFAFVKSKRSHVLLWTNQRRRVEEFGNYLNSKEKA